MPNGSADGLDNERRVFRLLSGAGFAPRTVYDIGAADGTWSNCISEIFPEASFQMFEPLARLFPPFEKNLEWQMRYHPTFRLHAVALGAETKPVTMRVHADGYSSTILDMGDHPDFRQREVVSQYRIDEYVEEFALPLPDLIKLDTQGAEQMILGQASRCLEHASLVFAETWLDRRYGPETPLLTELRDLLVGHGYELAEIGQRFYDGDHCLNSCDGFFLKRSLLKTVSSAMPVSSW
jgi:FkbM family methyltransferase